MYKLCCLFIIITLLNQYNSIAQNETNTLNPILNAKVEQVDRVYLGHLPITNIVFRPEKVITNSMTAQKLFRVWHDAKPGRARLAIADEGADVFLFVDTNQNPICALWYPYITRPSGARPYYVERRGNNYVFQGSMLVDQWLLGEVEEGLATEMRKQWVVFQ
jgi:hypothetical protein